MQPIAPAKVRRDFKIVDETADYIVIDKPPLLLAHPTNGRQNPSLWAELRHLLAFELASGGQISLVNRLDRETSGLVLVAKHRAAARTFGLLMQARRVQKEYLAIVWGWPEWEQKLVDAPLIRQGAVTRSAIYLKQTIHYAGAGAVTEFEVVDRFHKVTPKGHQFALLKARPITGRTHQVRVHAASTGHPIVGDKIYGGDETLYLRFIEGGWNTALERELLLERQALHASRLEVGDKYNWSSDLPDDLRRFVAQAASTQAR